MPSDLTQDEKSKIEEWKLKNLEGLQQQIAYLQNKAE